jgi:hypothetical protein
LYMYDYSDEWRIQKFWKGGALQKGRGGGVTSPKEQNFNVYLV